MAIPATQIRRGMVIVFEGQPCKVLEFRHHTPGNLRAMIQTKLRCLAVGWFRLHHLYAGGRTLRPTAWSPSPTGST